MILDKHQFTYEQWPWKNLPPYVEGPAFLISGSAIHSLLAAAQVTPYLWPNGSPDDLYVGGILSELANVTVRHFTNGRYVFRFPIYIFFAYCLK